MGKRARTLFSCLTVAAFCSVSTLASASVVISGTRVIYPAGDKEVTVKLNNVGSKPVLIQSWLDNGDINAKPENINVPFILTPPINRVEPSKGQTLRLSYTGANLPADRESVFWLNVLEIPAQNTAKSKENYLQMAFRSRIKLFFRPEGLTGDANDAGKALTWSPIAGGVKATNATPYYVSLVTVKVNGKEVEGDMVAPKSSLDFKGLNASVGSKVNVTFVNDYGALNPFEATVK